MSNEQETSAKKSYSKWIRLGAIALVVVGGLIFLVQANKPEGEKKQVVDAKDLLTSPVEFGTFVQQVVESGEVESSSNVEIRCEVDTPSAGLAIVEIVPEGSYVNEGDFLVRLDGSDLQDRLVTRQIDANSSRAEVAQAKADLQGARLELEEYKSGRFREQEEQMESDEFVAKENMRRAEEYLRYSRALAEKGYVSEVQLQADQFAVEKASKELEVSRTKLEVLRKFTKEKVITQLEADIEKFEARLSSAERGLEIDERQLAEVEEEIAACTIYAPTSGQVVYANKVNSAEEPLIEQGKFVRENQEIIRLPDPKRMQVSAEVNEARIDMLKEGMEVRIRIDALPGEMLSGELVKVTEFPLPRKNSYTAHIKNYGATIQIKSPPPSLKSGMTAEVAIIVQEKEDATQVPVQAVFERNKRFYCLVSAGTGKQAITAREIEIAASNDNYVMVEKGVEVDEQVVLSPESYADQVELPAPAKVASRADNPEKKDKKLAAK